MLQTFYELPQRASERSGYPEFLSTVCDRAVHEVHLGLALGENVLQHAGFMLAGSVGAFLDEGAGIAMELDAERVGERFNFGDARVEERAGGREAGGCAVVQKCESANGIRGGVKDEFGPWGAASVLKGNHFQTGAVQQLSKFFDARIGSVCRLKRADPGIAVNIKPNVAGFDDVTGRECRTANYKSHVFRQNFFIAYAVLYRADGAGVAEQVSGLLDRRAGVRALGSDDSEFARRDFPSICRRVEARSEIGGAADAQAAVVDRESMRLRNVVGVDFDIGEARKVGAEDAADGSATDDANLDAHAVFRASNPV